MNIVFLLSVLCLSIAQSKLESLKIPSRKSLKSCLVEKGLSHFAKRSDFIDLYANQDIPLSSLQEIIAVTMHKYAFSIKDTPAIDYITRLRKEDLMDCMFRYVPKEDLERFKVMITDSTCE